MQKKIQRYDSFLLCDVKTEKSFLDCYADIKHKYENAVNNASAEIPALHVTNMTGSNEEGLLPNLKEVKKQNNSIIPYTHI